MKKPILTRVESSGVVGQSYDPFTQTLLLEYPSGKIYEYKEVPAETYMGFLESDSKGRFAAQQIKPKFAGTMLEFEEEER